MQRQSFAHAFCSRPCYMDILKNAPELAMQCKTSQALHSPHPPELRPKELSAAGQAGQTPLQVLCSPHPLYTSPKEPLPMMSSS